MITSRRAMDLATGYGLAVLGERTLATVLVVHAFDTTRNTAPVAGLIVGIVAGGSIGVLIGGPLLDRLGLRRVVAGCTATAAVIALLLVGTSSLAFAALGVVTVAATIRIAGIGWLAAVPTHAASSVTRRSVGALQVSRRVGFVLGPMVAGWAIVLFERTGGIVLSAVFLAIGAGTAWRILGANEGRPNSIHRPAVQSRSGEIPGLLAPSVALAFVGLATGINNVALVPLVLDEMALGPGQYGIVSGSMGVGLLIGAVWVASPNRISDQRFVSVGLVGAAISLLVLASVPTYSSAVMTRTVAGVGLAVATATLWSTVVRNANDHRRSTLMSRVRVLEDAASALAAATVVGLLGRVSASQSMAVVGAALLLGYVAFRVTLIAWSRHEPAH